MIQSRHIVRLSLLGLALTLVMLGLQLGSLVRLEASHQASHDAIRLENGLEHVLRLLVDAETGQRGFLLTSKQVYLEPYNRAVSELPERLQAIHALLDQRPQQQARLSRLDGLAAAKMDELRETVTLSEAGKSGDALALVNSDRGMHLLGAIRALESTMVNAEEARLAGQRAASDRLARASLVASAIAAGFIVLDGALMLLVARESRKRQELRIADLESFAGRVAHDIRSPLSVAKLSIAVSKRKSGEGKVPAALDRANRALDTVCLLVEGLWTFAKAGARSEEGAEADVGSVIRDVVASARSAAGEHGVSLEVEEIAPAKVACNPGVLTSMMSNLIGNAIKYIGEAPIKRVVVRATSSRAVTRIEVSDTGPGVPRHLWPTIFDPYVRAPGTNAPGLGLGLATVRRLAEAHGGSIGIRNNVPSGSLFWIDLPNVPAPGPDSTRSRAYVPTWVRALRARLRTPVHR